MPTPSQVPNPKQRERVSLFCGRTRSASLWCRVKLARGREGKEGAPCHLIAIGQCHLSLFPLILLSVATPIFRDTIFSSQSPPSPPPVPPSYSSLRSTPSLPSRTYLTTSLFSFLLARLVAVREGSFRLIPKPEFRIHPSSRSLANSIGHFYLLILIPFSVFIRALAAAAAV